MKLIFNYNLIKDKEILFISIILTIIAIILLTIYLVYKEVKNANK